jgi:hypothetical protein
MLAHRVPEAVLDDLVERMRARNGLLLLGFFTADPPLPGSREPRYYNTVAASVATTTSRSTASAIWCRSASRSR